MKKLIVLFFALTVWQSASAEPSMRRCMLLPVVDSSASKLGFQIFEKTEEYLKDGEWCYYRPNSEIINILGNYKQNLNSHLQNKEVLKIVANKTRAGSIIRVELTGQVDGVDIQVEVIGANGSDQYFKEKTHLTTTNPETIALTIQNWLNLYAKNIPYDGRVIGVLGDQFTVDFGRASSLHVGTEVDIVRPTQKKQHPLLKEVVDWDTKKLAVGKIVEVENQQSQGRVIEVNSRSKIKIEDWVRVRKTHGLVKERDDIDKSGDQYKFGKLGRVGVNLSLGTGSQDQLEAAGSNNKIGGTLFGVGADLEMWMTRKYWAGAEVGKKYGTYKNKEGTTGTSNIISTTTFKMKGGYKYLPLGFFYGPQIDGYIGYSRYNYGLDTDTTFGNTETTFSGIMLGMRADMPIYNNHRLFFQVEILPLAGFEEEIELHSGEDRSIGYDLELGGTYYYSPNMSFLASLNYVSNKAKFKSGADHGIREIEFKETALNCGAVFTF